MTLRNGFEHNDDDAAPPWGVVEVQLIKDLIDHVTTRTVSGSKNTAGMQISNLYASDGGTGIAMDASGNASIQGNIFGAAMAKELTSTKIAIVAGTCKQGYLPGAGTPSDDKWGYVTDSDHTPLNVTGDYAQAAPSGSDAFTLRITYGQTFNRVLGYVIAPDETLSSTYCLTCGGSVGLTFADIKASVSLVKGGYIAYAGGAWGDGGAFTGQDINVQSLSYASGTGILTVTHNYCPGGLVQLYPRYFTATPYLPVLDSVADTSFTVRFIDLSTGSFVTGAETTNMAFQFDKKYSYRVELDGTNGSDDLNLGAGNLWFIGIFEE